MSTPPPSAPTTLVIVLGAYAWPKSPGFQESKAFMYAAQGFKDYMLDPQGFGLTTANLLDLFDADSSASDQLEQLGSFLEQRTQALKAENQAVHDVVVYFVGHGGFADSSSDFYLLPRPAIASSLRASGIGIDALAEVLREKSRQTRRYLFLDCCFAAAAFSSFQGGPDQTAIAKTLDAFQVQHKSRGFPRKGTVLLCSSDQKTPSLLLSDKSCTMFSYALLDVLRNGDSHRSTQLSVRDIKELAEDRLEALPEQNAPRPSLHSPDQSEGDVADVPFFPNLHAERERARVAEEKRRRQAEEAEQIAAVEELKRRLLEAAKKRKRKARKKQVHQAAEQERIPKAKEEEVRKAAGQTFPRLFLQEPKIRYRIGEIIGPYRLIRFIGQGNTSTLYLGEDILLRTQAAVKVLDKKLIGDEVKRFSHEARIIASLEHPNIVRLLDFGLSGVGENVPYLIRNYAPNGSLRQWNPKGTQVPLGTVIGYVRQLAGALQFAHDRGLIHKEVKPENMLVGRQNEVLLSDFNFMDLVLEASLLRPNVIYYAPEQAEAGHAAAGPATDQYSLGLVVYEWLSGDLPFGGSAIERILNVPPPLHEKLPSLSSAVEQVVMVALAKDPKQRFSSIQAFATAFEHASLLRK